nr:biotin--[acetyl-CoA-carboxylase] ligase [Sphingomonas lutea]
MRIVDLTGSTNSDMLNDATGQEGDWLIARQQDAGRGRQGRTWVSVDGNFFGSTIVDLKPEDPPAQSLSLVAGLALIEAIDIAVPGQALMLKWPNDVLLLGRKLAGILLERQDDRIAAGFGVNLAGPPKLDDRQAAGLNGQIAPDAFAPLLAASFARLINLWRRSDLGLLVQAWLARAHPIGTRLKVHASADSLVAGRFDGLERDGALRLRRDDGSLELVRAGDVEL